jgi:hypothetical protein
MIRKLFIISLFLVSSALSFQSCLSNDVLEYDITNTHPLDPEYDGENFWYIKEIEVQEYPWYNKVDLYVYLGIDWSMFENLSATKSANYSIQKLKVDIVDTNNNLIKRNIRAVWNPIFDAFTASYDFDNSTYSTFDISQYHFQVQAIYVGSYNGALVEGKVYDVYL